MNSYVLGAVGVVKSFTPSNIPLNGASTVRIALTNPYGTTMKSVAFVDDMSLQPGLFATSAPVLLESACILASPSLSLSLASPTSVVLANLFIPAQQTCTIQFQATGTITGNLINNLGNVTAANAVWNASATATLTVLRPPVVNFFYTSQQIILGSCTVLNINITNPNAVNMTGISFVKTVPLGVNMSTVGGSPAPLPVVSGSVSAGFTITGGSPLSLAGGASAVYTIVACGATQGNKDTSALSVTTTNAGNGLSLVANLTVVGPLTVSAAYATTSIALGAVQTKTLTLDNTYAGAATQFNVSFDDLVPFRFQAIPSSISLRGSGCTGDLSSSTSSVIQFRNGTVPGGGVCIIEFQLDAVLNGTADNLSFNVTSSNGPQATSNIATQYILAGAVFSKVYPSAPTFGLNSETQLNFSLYNPNDFAMTGVVLTENFPAQVAGVISSISGGTGCPTMSVSTRSASLSGTVSALTQCTYSALVLGIQTGLSNNFASFRSINSPLVNTSASIYVMGAPIVLKRFGNEFFFCSILTH